MVLLRELVGFIIYFFDDASLITLISVIVITARGNTIENNGNLRPVFLSNQPAIKTDKTRPTVNCVAKLRYL